MTTSIFQSLGLDVLSVTGGVYHLRRSAAHTNAGTEVVGLLLSDDLPLTKKTRSVKLFLQDVVDNVPAARIVSHWQTLDARRFEESGLEPLVLDLVEAQIPEHPTEQNYTRPDSARQRHAVRLVNGEVVCYN